MTRGWPTFVVMLVLVAGVYAAPDATLKWAALAGLAFLSLATLPVGSKPHRRAAKQSREKEPSA